MTPIDGRPTRELLLKYMGRMKKKHPLLRRQNPHYFVLPWLEFVHYPLCGAYVRLYSLLIPGGEGLLFFPFQLLLHGNPELTLRPVTPKRTTEKSEPGAPPPLGMKCSKLELWILTKLIVVVGKMRAELEETVPSGGRMGQLGKNRKSVRFFGNADHARLSI